MKKKTQSRHIFSKQVGKNIGQIVAGCSSAHFLDWRYMSSTDIMMMLSWMDRLNKIDNNTYIFFLLYHHLILFEMKIDLLSTKI